MSGEQVPCHLHLWFGNHYLMPLGRFHDALDEMKMGLEGDPINLLYRHHLAVGFRHAGRLVDAEAELRQVLALDENFLMAVGTLGAVCAQQGRFAEALTLSERACALTPWTQPVVGQLAALLVRTGASGRAETLLDGLRSGTACGAPAGMAVYHAMCGEFDRAAEWAERAIDVRYPGLVAILRPLLGPLPCGLPWRER